MNPSDGSFVKKLHFEKKEALDVSHIEGKRGDFVVLLLRKVKLFYHLQEETYDKPALTMSYEIMLCPYFFF